MTQEPGLERSGLRLSGASNLHNAEAMAMNDAMITFIGGGNMATSLIGGLVADNYPLHRILVSEPDPGQRAKLASLFAIQPISSNVDAIAKADVIILATKPQDLADACRELASAIQHGTRRPLVISIAAGVRVEHLQRWLGGEVALVRTMPNTPAMIQAGATALYAAEGVTEEQRNQAETVMRAVGITQWVDREDLIDVVTAVSGSGPAYFFLIMEAIEAAALRLGLAPGTARLLTLQTALGAARMAIESSDSPALLRQKVTSPGGTTERALACLEEGDVRRLFDAALEAARDRSVELSRLFGDA
ncbi:Pyrroline-5-carboxylate reductase [Gammaproteobacteria bacterium]